MTVNKKTVKIASGAAGIILAVSACGTETYDYKVSGLVQGQQVDYDCPNELSMDAVAFVAGHGKGGGGKSSSKNSGSSSSSDSSDSDSSSSSNTTTNNRQQQNRSSGTTNSKAPSKAPSKAASTPASKAPSTGSGTTRRSASPTATPVKNKGVKLKEKPEKPEKLKGKKLPKLKYKFKPKGCETEYEIFVLADDGYLYEQDVRKVDYDKCLKAKVPAGKKSKLFPLCTKG